MTLKDFITQINTAATAIQNTTKMEDVLVEFSVDDRSEGTTITVDNMPKIMYDLINPGKVVIHLD